MPSAPAIPKPKPPTPILMHDVPYGLAIWLGGLIPLVVFVLYVLPWWRGRRASNAPPDERDDRRGPGA